MNSKWNSYFQHPVLLLLCIIAIIKGQEEDRDNKVCANWVERQEPNEFMTSLLMRYSTINSSGDRKPLGVVNIAAATAAMIALDHCNRRDGSILPALAKTEMAGCDGLSFRFRSLDTRDEARWAIQEYSRYYQETNFVIGPIRSASAIPVSTLSSAHNIPMISFKSTSEELDDTSLYRYFSRTIPSDRENSKALAQLFAKYKLENVGMLFIDDSYGSDFRDAIATECATFGITVHAYGYRRDDNVKDAETSIDLAITQLATLKLNVVFVVVFARETQYVLSSLRSNGMTGEGHLLVFSDSVTLDNLQNVVQADPSLAKVINGTQTMSAVGGDNENGAFVRLREAWPSYTNYSDYVNSYLPGGGNFSDTEDLKGFTNQIEDPERFFRASVELVDDVLPYAYDAAAAVCRAACMLYSTRNTSNGNDWKNGDKLYETLFASDFPFQGTSGKVMLNQYGSRDAGTVVYKLRNILVSSGEGRVSHSDAGRWENSSHWRFTNVRFPPGNVRTVPYQSPIPYHELNHINNGFRIFACLSVSLVILMCVCLGIWTWKNRRESCVKKAQPEFLLIFLLGVMIAVSSLIPYAHSDEGFRPSDGKLSCNSIPWLFSLGTTISVAGIVVKLYRIYRIFTNPSLQSLSLKTTDLYMAVLFLVVVNVAILSAWFFSAPLVWKRVIMTVDMYGRPTESYGVCTSTKQNLLIVFASLLVTFHVLCYIAGAFFAYRVRGVDSDFQESKYLVFALIFQAQLYMLGIPIYLAVSSDASTVRFAVLFMICALGNIASTGFIFTRKVYVVWLAKSQRQKNGEAAVPGLCVNTSNVDNSTKRNSGSQFEIESMKFTSFADSEVFESQRPQGKFPLTDDTHDRRERPSTPSNSPASSFQVNTA